MDKNKESFLLEVKTIIEQAQKKNNVISIEEILEHFPNAEFDKERFVCS